MSLVALEDIRVAARRLVGIALRTPLVPATWAPPGQELLLKAESLQPIGAFKIRGAYNAIAALPPDVRARGVVAHSSGNHAQAVAYAAREFGIRATIVIPHAASEVKVLATLALGAEVVRVPTAERLQAAQAIVDRDGRVMVPPFDHPGVIAGQGTVGLEVIEDAPPVDRVLVPIGGGGLISGVAVAVKALSPTTEVIGVEPELAADAQQSLRGGDRVAWSVEDTGRTIADGLRVPTVGNLPWQHLHALVDDVVTVTEAEIRSAVRQLALGSRLVVEPSGAVSVAAFRAGRMSPVTRTVAVLSGGNIDPVLLAALVSEAPDEPGVSSSSDR